ncbi:nucleotidyl transferase AbiEii/AbiGii toxin family protein [Listeria innocua]|uniref:nucleotidyl transferase AbiEii/AbiGii toxin family protein n=1 Tax=Listeria innocua TaxID=1642 RepID=UPI001C8942D0|nr:nucleotidyl transferase AbiEii/AbiGii toxin family protein [Listeria innocua]
MIHFPQLFDEGEISLLAYPLETVLAEKLETIVSRGTGNTRPRDFYDVYILQKLKAEQYQFRCSQRGTGRNNDKT